ncbi:amidophosphoribosyltransferase [Pseudoxanthomonas yeongjuensis]|uniref:ComF family protein n=1 Tax=Pseudoxanthomonas yeongjuensis TaxID=377616 RepID=UPI0013912456|nr:ComF family protein [Pseudoxanthomonas yeongjuensis]KAF1715611.1 amidophosphoribosyltransferase [Pseudoxanthomonas yeongjuensis]
MDALKVDGWLRKAVRTVFPPRCLLCGESGANNRDLCPACAEALPWNASACLRCALPLPVPATCGACLQKPPSMDETHAVFVYGFPLDRLVPRLKFHNDLAAGRLLSGLMAEALGALPRPAALVPVPLHGTRLGRRGYDQALELAAPLARSLRIPLLADVLLRTRATAPQSELDAGARQRNLRRAFAVRADAPLPGHVALVDDVMTTGATLEAAARALRRAGVSRVDAWVCARVP